ncbi:hypothetical protein CO058_02405 [candidate division WWE3 bacterium CG_4_9_14_0_2_um_filter_35_11]|uniref:Nucleoside 2-deoxyribosyltransferase n=1 Tax=candidate division WWE3 bacterium CG_4_9_14_0_2_um_filter_35_11 TaxID=1975077 RepID=A0A2M8ELM0_UNCKA|nr:MAG: hypothetical protein COV25_02665 [candidate division WWE3 bacterium CG10_big_fil_rev_8_21_14_0_10_35_32]PJC23587.1 MAG: hypothetical protein CO058_02405 [candidate division WWE3 bacterium CG_4_9_14_0_2_um_filter_35_11]
MKIYFLGAISGLNIYRKNYEKEVHILEKMGHVVLSDHILKRDHNRPETFVIKGDKEYFEYMTARIRSSGLVVADISHPTANIGYEISYALSNNVPVLALYSEDKGRKVFPLLVGIQSDLLILRGYDSRILPTILKDEVGKLEDAESTKFTIMINNEIAAYLDWSSKKNKTTRSAFIKKIIENYMTSDKLYKKP